MKYEFDNSNIDDLNQALVKIIRESIINQSGVK